MDQVKKIKPISMNILKSQHSKEFSNVLGSDADLQAFGFSTQGTNTSELKADADSAILVSDGEKAVVASPEKEKLRKSKAD